MRYECVTKHAQPCTLQIACMVPPTLRLKPHFNLVLSTKATNNRHSQPGHVYQNQTDSQPGHVYQNQTDSQPGRVHQTKQTHTLVMSTKPNRLAAWSWPPNKTDSQPGHVYQNQTDSQTGYVHQTKQTRSLATSTKPNRLTA